MEKTYPLRASLLALLLAFAPSPFAFALSPIYDPLSNGRTALAQQTPEALEIAHQAFKTGLETFPNNAELNFFYTATLLAREAHTDSFKQQFTSLNATIVNPSIYALEYSFPLGFAGILLPPAGLSTDAHLTYLNSKVTLIDEALMRLDKITEANFTVTLTSSETSLLDTKVDFADVCLLRSGLRSAKAALHLANSYNLSVEYRKLYDLYAAGNLTPQAVLAAIPQLFNLSLTPARRSDARTQIQLAHAEWNKALSAIKTKRPTSEGSILGPIGYSDTTPFLFAFDSIAAAEEVGVQFNALVTSLTAQETFPTIPSRYYALQGYKINLSTLVASPSGLRYLAPTRFDRGFFRPSTWPDATLGGVFPEATQDFMNDAGNILFLLQPTVYEPYQFWLLAGTPDEPGYFKDGKVLFKDINGIAVDANGNIYVADQGNHVIRKISVDNKVTTIAGQKWTEWNEREALQRQYEGYPAYYPAILDSNIRSIAVDGNGTVYFVNGRIISKLTAGGKLSNLAGSLPWSYQDAKDGLGADAQFAEISAIATDKNGNLYLCDLNAIRKISPTGQVTTLAGKLGWDESEGYVDGAGPVARFNNPTGIAVDDAGVIYVIDSDNSVIRKIQPNGTTSTFVGDAKISNHLDGKGTKSRLNRPEGLAIDSGGNLYFADRGTIRKVKPDGTVTTIAGKLNPEHGAFRIRGQMGIQEAAGEAAIFGEDDVTGLAVDRRGTLYASFENSIYEAESITALPSGTPFSTPTPFPLPTAKPSPAPSPNPAPTPDLLSLTLSTNTVDLSNGAVALPINISTSEEIGSFWASFSNNVSIKYINSSSLTYNSNKKIKNALIYLPSYTKEGTYNLNSLSYYWGDYPNSQSASFYGDSIPAAFKDISITVINPFTDSTPPIIHSLTLLSTEANASNASAKIRYRVQISDENSGFSNLMLSFIAPAGTYTTISDSLGFWDSPVAVDGPRKTYEGTLEIPQGIAEGDWTIQYLNLWDKAGNGGPVTLTNELQAIKFKVISSATNSAQPQDQYAPLPVALTVNKTTVDVSSSDQKVKVQLTINNDDLPTNYWSGVDFNLDGETWSGNSFIASDFQLISGTVANGVYEGELLIPRYAKNGNYTISSISITENNQSGGSKSYNKWGDSIPVEFRKTISVTGTQDVTAPVLQNIAVSPSSADTRNGMVLITNNLTITDDLSGLQETQWSRAGALALRSPSGKEFLWSEFSWADRISGNSTNGTYQVQFELPQYSEEGAWTIDYIELVDRNYNTRFLIPANLTTQQLAASTIQVQGWARGWEQQSFASATSTKGNATIQLSNLNLTYNGTEKVPTIATNPGNLTQNVTLTYNGTTTPPIDAGSYTVVAFMNHPAYQGRQVETMTISNPPPPPPPPAPAPGGGAPSSGGGELEKSKKGKKGSAKKGGSDKKSLNKKSDKKSSGGGDSKKSKGKKSGGKKSGGKKSKRG